MSALVSASSAFTPAQLAIIKKSVAPDTNNDEFDLFVETCKLYGLNPMKRQIGARVYSKDKPDKRSMAIITEIGGLRAIAARHGNYMPDEADPEYAFDDAAVDPKLNPLGLVRAKVYVKKMDNNGVWHRFPGVAKWAEFAPVEDVWDWDEQARKRKPTGEKKLGDTWQKMPELMLAKCAEAQALRRGWPEDLSGLYAAEELHKADADHTATEVLNQVAAEQRLQKISGPKDGYAIIWGMGEPMEMVAPGRFYDRVEEWARSEDRSALSIREFRATNKPSLQRYWADQPRDALELNRVLEGREKALEAELAGAA